MKSQTQHIGNYSNVFDYSPFGAPLDGRTIQNIFHQEEITDTYTVVKTIYVLEETFDVASDWQDVTSYSQITYPSGKMRVASSSSSVKRIGAKKGFTTGTGQHTVSFEMASLPSGVCAGLPGGGVVMGAQHNETSDTLAGTGSYQIQSTSPHYVVVEIRNENNALVLKDSTNSTGTYSYAFSAPQGKQYTISFHNKSMCANLGYQIDNVFISYDTLEVVTGNTIIVSDTLFIINNDFENPVIEPNGAGVKIDGWTHYSPSTTLSVEPHNGSDWLKVVSTNGTHGAHQGFSVEPGETYTFEIDLHRPSGMNNVINIVIWKNTGPSGAYTLHVLNTDGFNTFNYTATSSNIYIQIRQAGTYYLDNIRMYRTYEDTMFVGGFDVDMAYRYGYNTQEKVDEIAGAGNHYTAPYWEYDPRVVHRWNRDPMAFKYPWQSPYVINNNNPIWFHDPLGDEFDPASQEVVDEHKEFTRNEINTLENDLMFLNSLNSALGNNYEGMDPFNEVMAEINRVEEALAELNDALVEITILENSDQMYSVVQMTSKTKEGFTGVTKYENGIVVAYYSDNSTLAHELKHLYQFENKQISFAPEGGPGYLYDATDEIEAYTRQSYYNGDISIRKMSADDVRNLHENYQDLKDGPINANILIKEIFKGSQYLEDVGFKIMNMTFETWNQTRKVDIIKQ